MDASPRHLPDDLSHLRDLHRELPPRSARWRTVKGGTFLASLARAVDLYQARTCAEALGISTAAVYQMLDRPLPSKPSAWPSQEDLRPLMRAWTSIDAVRRRGDTVRRNSREFRLVHVALTHLLTRYEMRDLVAILKTDSRTLTRFTQPPLELRNRQD